MSSILLVLFSLLVQGVYGQDKQTRYLAGNDFYKKGKYQAAMEAFKPLLSESEDNPFPEYAYYFYALSAYKAEKYEDARVMVKQLLLKYPNWDKKEEAQFLLGAVLFEQGKYKDALQVISELGKNFDKDGAVTKKYYLDKMTSVESLKWLYQNYPRDKELALVLASRLDNTSEGPDQMLFNYLIEEFKLDRAKLLPPAPVSVKKKEYNVAVMFPFMVSKLPVENVNRSNQFLLDMYQGMRIAGDSLAVLGIKINLYAYDTDKDVNKFRQLLQESDLARMDLIVGPVYPAHLPLINEFSRQHAIQVVCPFTNDITSIESNPFAFLFQSGYDAQADAIADYNMKLNKPEKKVIDAGSRGKQKEIEVLRNKVIIIYGESEKDSVMAVAYQSALVNSVGEGSDSAYKLHSVKKVNRESIPQIKQMLTDSVVMISVNHIAAFTNDQVIAANVISSMEIRGFNVPVYTTSEWLDFNLITVEQFERRGVHFLYPDFLDFGKPGVEAFRKKYMNATRLYPTTFAFQGNDIVHLFGRMLHSYGTYFGKNLQQAGFIPGNTLVGFNYTSAQSNQFIPIVRFVGGRLEMVNKTSN